MATFFILPPRPALEGALPALFDLAQAPVDLGAQLADALRAALTHGDGFALFREELPDDTNLAEALCDGFGAEPGDDVIELRLTADGLQARTWRFRSVSKA